MTSNANEVLNFAPGWLTKQAACRLEHEAAIKALGEVRL